MPWAQGQSGNPHGRLIEKIATDALRIAALTVIRSGKHKGLTKLRRAAEAIMAKACKGEPWACQMVWDRLDGKAIQPITQDITLEAGQVFADLLRALNEQRTNGDTAKVIEHTAPQASDAVAVADSE